MVILPFEFLFGFLYGLPCFICHTEEGDWAGSEDCRILGIGTILVVETFIVDGVSDLVTEGEIFLCDEEDGTETEWRAPPTRTLVRVSSLFW